MKLHLNSSEGNRITACQDNIVYINNDAHHGSLLVLPDKLITDWQITQIKDINETILAQAAEYSTQGMVVLLGGGDKSPPINPHWQVPFIQRGAVLEIMSLPAACRTYNFLNADGRLVMAALILAPKAAAADAPSK